MAAHSVQTFTTGYVAPIFTHIGHQFQILWQHTVENPTLMSNLLWAVILFLLTLVFSKISANSVRRLSRRLSHKDADRTLPEFFSQVVGWLILVMGLVAVLNRLGVQTASLITVLGAASLAIGLALQGTLTNVAAGLMLLFNKPYRIGDTIQFGEVRGTVHRLGVFNTEIDNLDNVRVYVPNSKIFSNEISNLSTNSGIKIEIQVGLDYKTDLTQTLEILHTVAMNRPERLSTHEPAVNLSEFAASAITARVFLWVMPAQALTARTGLIIDIKKALDAAGIEIPYPHQVEMQKK